MVNCPSVTQRKKVTEKCEIVTYLWNGMATGKVAAVGPIVVFFVCGRG
jgi:hypothetical protein